MSLMQLLPQIVFYSFVGVVFIQVCYYIFIFFRLAHYKIKEQNTVQEHPVSVIICAKNEAQNIANNLPGFLVQDYKTTHEIIVVNDNSEDDTRYVIDEFKKTFKHINDLELVQEAKLIMGKKFPLSMGIKSSKYETLLLSDADCVPASEHWMKTMQSAYTKGKDIVLGYGAYFKQPGLLNKIIRFETFHTALQYFSYALAGMPYMGVGRNLSYKRQLFFENKGFSSINQIPSGDDDLFINKVATKTNTTICIEHEAHTLSQPKTSFKSWQLQKYRHFTTSKFYKTKHKFFLGTYSASFIMLYPLLAASIVLYPIWWVPLCVFGVRFLLQAYTFNKAMKKLNESDLFAWFWLLDIWMFIYHIIFIPALWRKPKASWN
ncbi:MAG: glycosyltransferase [Chitinophagaceae bacterium]|jgi:glycosyltransferase involved in cell wall biosynthesis